MKKLLLVCLVGALLGGCGGEQSAEEKEKAEAAEKKKAEEKVKEEVEEAKQWAEWEANPKPYGGTHTLSLIRRVKEEGIKNFTIRCTSITDVSPLAGLKNLKKLKLIITNPIPDDQKEKLRKALPNCEILFD